MAFNLESACGPLLEAPALRGVCLTQIPNQFRQDEIARSPPQQKKDACPRLTSNLRLGAWWRGAQPLRAPLIRSQPHSSLCRRCFGRLSFFSIASSVLGKIRPPVMHVCSGCGVMGNDTGLLGGASVRAPLSPCSTGPALLCATGLCHNCSNHPGREG